MSDSARWMNKAALYELLASAFRFTTEEISSALTSGEFSEAYREIGRANGLDPSFLDAQVALLGEYVGKDDEVFHRLRQEYTRLFIGKNTLITPYAGVQAALDKGEQPILMIGKESMAIERFMRRCGIGQPEGTNEPLDHIASLLEFLYYLCLVKVDAVKPPKHADIRESDYETFFADHVAGFTRVFAESTVDRTHEDFFACSAQLLLVLEP